MNDFRQDKAIYMQIADRICDAIIAGEYGDGDRIPSVREYSVHIGVNANTVVRTYDTLSRLGIIYTKRGLGYFVTAEARDIIISGRRKRFLDDTLPEMVRQMKLLGLPETVFHDEWQKKTEI